MWWQHRATTTTTGGGGCGVWNIRYASVGDRLVVVVVVVKLRVRVPRHEIRVHPRVCNAPTRYLYLYTLLCAVMVRKPHTCQFPRGE